MQANQIAKFKAACAAADVDCDGFDMKCAKVKMWICDGKPYANQSTVSRHVWLSRVKSHLF